ncbi:hypothetical protein ACP4OV_015333 [Aristida adscensionis]
MAPLLFLLRAALPELAKDPPSLICRSISSVPLCSSAADQPHAGGKTTSAQHTQIDTRSPQLLRFRLRSHPGSPAGGEAAAPMSYYNPHAAHVGVPPPQGYPMEAYANKDVHQQQHQHGAPPPPGQQQQPQPPMGYPEHHYAQPYAYPPPPPYPHPHPPYAQPYPPYAQPPPPPPPPRHAGPSFAQGCSLQLAVAAASWTPASDLGCEASAIFYHGVPDRGAVRGRTGSEDRQLHPLLHHQS